VPFEQEFVFTPKPADERKEWFKRYFLENKDFVTKRNAEFAVRISKIDGDLYFGKISRKKIVDLSVKTPVDIEEHEVENWPFSEFVCDTRLGSQIIIFAANPDLFVDVENFKNQLTEISNQEIYRHGYRISFEVINSGDEFWNTIQENDFIYSIEFRLQSPNMFGAGIKANEALKDIQKLFNNTEIDIRIQNQQGKLQAPKSELEKYREYSDKGGGKWQITARKKGRKKRKYKSENSALKYKEDFQDQDFSTLHIDENLLEKGLKNALEFFKPNAEI
jgi:hypothetical protein